MLIIVLMSAFCLQWGYAQVKDGRAVYERKVNMHRRLEDPGMKNMLPEFSISKAELLFSSDESLWRNIKEEEDIRDEAGEDQNRPVVRMRFGGAEDQTYRNYATDKMVQQREMGPKKYIIEDSFPHQSWKMEADTQRIKGFLCRKATTTTTARMGPGPGPGPAQNAGGTPVVAWYAEDIQAPSGPEVYGGLPGLILQLDVNDGEMVFTVTELDTKLDKGLVKAPADGKKITRVAFQKMMEEQFGPEGRGGRPTIRIIRN